MSLQNRVRVGREKKVESFEIGNAKHAQSQATLVSRQLWAARQRPGACPNYQMHVCNGNGKWDSSKGGQARNGGLVVETNR